MKRIVKRMISFAVIAVMEKNIPTVVMQEEETTENSPAGKYMIGGICIVLLAVLLKTIRKGRGR